MFDSKRCESQGITFKKTYLKIHINLKKLIKNELFLLGTKGGPAIRPKGSMPSSSLSISFPLFSNPYSWNRLC